LNRKPIRDFYTIGDEIGKGAFSIVVEAIQKESNREVAIKIVDKKKILLLNKCLMNLL